METLLVFDFDGVICDSLDECLVSSWVAYHRLSPPRGRPDAARPRRPAPPGGATSCRDGAACGDLLPDRVPITLRDAFLRLRPFIYRGEDFVLIQELLHRGVPVDSQAEFDRQIARAGPERMDLYRDRIYRVRAELLRRDRPFWLRLNRIYPHVRRWLGRLAAHPAFFILSTKRAPLIREILLENGISLPLSRIIDAGRRHKLPLVSALLDEQGARRAVFLEDQIAALRGNRDARIECRLAGWGYIRPEWLQAEPGVRVLDAEGLDRLLGALLS